ncbi:hypothetical protein ACPXCE_04095 [Streptomyces sp. DT24]|uniref:hypothetical protein n=1 Tax=unclassified Streptomyces TaxID=2593676 RepID=UPI0023B921FE|nr:hypothetical protein [Streptomyces sp. AM 4-1-1]WEH37757.1 hypothetical protein PZB75_29750 [Streptomyces sp. AM 4-1-1]
MSFTDRTEIPIYAGLVEEQGDVLAEVRQVAEQTLREAGRAIDFSDIRAPARWTPPTGHSHQGGTLFAPEPEQKQAP